MMAQHIRPLTYDEKKAAEAAFKGLPFDPIWSDAALTVYLGISSVMKNKPPKAFQEDSPMQTTASATHTVSVSEEISRM